MREAMMVSSIRDMVRRKFIRRNKGKEKGNTQ